MSRNSFITVKNFSKTFNNKKKVLSKINFELFKGESLVVIGCSGSGKSVLLKCITGLILPDDGSTLLVEKQDLTFLHISKRQSFLKKFGMLFQNNALFDSMPIWQNISFGLLNMGDLDNVEAIKYAEEKLNMVGLKKEVAMLYPSELSGGMQKRAAIARGIAMNPEIIFFDEPTSGLDPVLSAVIGDVIFNLQKELFATTIIITHDISVMKKLADKVVMIHEGKLVWFGTLKETLNTDNPYIQQFMNTSINGPIHTT